MQSYGSKELDASLLMIPLVGFLPATDPRVRGTVAAIERDLMRDGFVDRYDTDAGGRRPAAGRGGVPALHLLAGRQLRPAWAGTTRPAGVFERLLALRNDVGLLSEEYDPRGAAAGGQLPAGVLARRPGQHGVQPRAPRKGRPGADPQLRRRAIPLDPIP